VQEPLDGLAFIGHNPKDRDNVFIATGDSGNGITHGTIAGMLLTDLVLGRKNEWAGLYDPARKIVEPYKGGSQGWRPGRKKGKKQVENALARLRAGTGTVIERRGAKPIAAYRDQKGALHAYSAVCTHLGCTVSWNDAEKSFDCSCHGSRFSYAGRTVNGPANDALAKLDDKRKPDDKA
jgi:Rieske Fe-S protein